MAAAKSGSRERGRGSSADSLTRTLRPQKHSNVGTPGPPNRRVFKYLVRKFPPPRPIFTNAGLRAPGATPHPPRSVKGNGAGRLRVEKVFVQLGLRQRPPPRNSSRRALPKRPDFLRVSHGGGRPISTKAPTASPCPFQ